jgi:hypothetical protein
VVTALLNEKLIDNKSVSEQFNDQLLRLLFKQHKSAAHFFEDNEN